jgi:quercetin dioxygenase-like cupin family protein
LWKLSDLKRAHAGQNNWQEQIVRNPEQEATYNSAAPGTALGRRMHTDTPVLFVVIAGEMHFNVAEQPAVVATRGSLVNILPSTIFSYDVAGAQNALWVEIDPADYTIVYPAADAAPPARAGADIVKVAFSPTPGTYSAPNVLHWNFYDALKQCTQGGVRVTDSRIYASPLSGFADPADPANTCAPANGRGGRGAAPAAPAAPVAFDPNSTFGHMHAGMAEWWIIQAGHISGRFEGTGEFHAEEGDVLYAPPMTWHQMGFEGAGISERLAIAPYPFNNMNNTGATQAPPGPAISASAQTGAPAAAAPAAAAGPLQSVDVPITGKPQTVSIAKRVFRPGENAGFHTHDGIEIAQVISGAVEITERGGSSKVYSAGESFVVRRGVVHDAKNTGTTDAQLAITYVLDKGAPLRVMVPQ